MSKSSAVIKRLFIHVLGLKFTNIGQQSIPESIHHKSFFLLSLRQGLPLDNLAILLLSGKIFPRLHLRDHIIRAQTVKNILNMQILNDKIHQLEL